MVVGNGLPRISEIRGMRWPSPQKTRNTGASAIHGMLGMRSKIALRFAGSATMTMSPCCRSLFDGDDSATAQSRRSRPGSTGLSRYRRCTRRFAIRLSVSRPAVAGSTASVSPNLAASAWLIASASVGLVKVALPS